MEFITEPYSQKVEKPWGYEIIFTPEGIGRVGKILFVRAGNRLSLQYHEVKEETLALFSGNAKIFIEDASGVVEEKSMQLQSGYTILPKQKHRIEAVEDSFVVEVSTPEVGTTVRLEDDFSRVDETDEMRKTIGRGWNN